MAEPLVEVPTKRRQGALWTGIGAAAWVTLVGVWFAVITWPESATVYLWLAAPLVICLLSLSATRRGASKTERWLYVAALAMLTLVSLASFGMFLVPALIALIVAQTLTPGNCTTRSSAA